MSVCNVYMYFFLEPDPGAREQGVDVIFDRSHKHNVGIGQVNITANLYLTSYFFSTFEIPTVSVVCTC